MRAEYQRSFAPPMLLWKGIAEFVARNPRYARLIGPLSVSGDYLDTSKHLLVDFLRGQCFDHLGHSIDCLLLVDLRDTEPRELRQYMRAQAAARFTRKRPFASSSAGRRAARAPHAGCAPSGHAAETPMHPAGRAG